MTVYALGLYDPDKYWDVKITNATGDQANHPEASVSVESEYVMVGGGAIVNWSSEGNLLTASFPFDESRWQAKAKDHINPDPSTITVYALGLKSNHPDPSTITVYALGLKSNLEGITIHSLITQSTSQRLSHPSAFVSQSSNYFLMGGGAQIDYTGTGNLLTASFPSAEGTTTWQAKSQDHIYPDPATITAYAVGIQVLVNG